MATTIQLRTGTGSAVPANLTQGELAINIDNGLFYYGSGSANDRKQLETFTNITASIISASGTVTASAFTGSFVGDGSGLTGTIAGTISASNVVMPFTNITASVISASGTITASAFTGSLVGDLTGTATNATNIIATTNTENESQFVAFLDNNNSTGQQVLYDAGLKYNPSLNNLNIAGNLSAVTQITASGTISASGIVTAPSYVGVPIILGRASQYIGSAAQNEWYYGNNTQGFFHHSHAGKLTTVPPGQAIGQGSQHNAVLLPCDVYDIELRASARTNTEDAGFAFWVLKNTRPHSAAGNSTLVFMGSASVAGTDIGDTHEGKFWRCDLTGSHSYRTNMTASEEEQLWILFEAHDATQSSVKYYWTLSARTKE